MQPNLSIQGALYYYRSLDPILVHTQASCELFVSPWTFVHPKGHVLCWQFHLFPNDALLLLYYLSPHTLLNVGVASVLNFPKLGGILRNIHEFSFSNKLKKKKKIVSDFTPNVFLIGEG